MFSQSDGSTPGLLCCAILSPSTPSPTRSVAHWDKLDIGKKIELYNLSPFIYIFKDIIIY